MQENVCNMRMLDAFFVAGFETCIDTKLLNELPLITSRIRIKFGGAAAINRCGLLKRQPRCTLFSKAAAIPSAATAVTVMLQLVAVLNGVLQQGLDKLLIDILLSQVRVVVNDVRKRYSPQLGLLIEFESLVVRTRILAQRQL